MTDLSVLIPARNEEFLAHTIEDILQNMRGNTEVIAVCDGGWPDPPIKDHPRVTLIHHAESIGQRAATNEAARISKAKYIMKVDAHCAFDEGFDIKLMENCEPDWTIIPRMYNLHAFSWVCPLCGHSAYQGPRPERCDGCGDGKPEREMVWQRKKGGGIDYMFFSNKLRFSYFDRNYMRDIPGDWKEVKRKYHHKFRPWAQNDITDQMTAIGACWMMRRERFFELGGLDEAHGSWGQLGVEIACKSWLSGGRQMINKKTWFAHMFRTQKDFGFPYPNPGISKARKYSHKLWLQNKWPQARHDLKWLVDKFAPVPTWNGISLLQS